MTRTVGLASLSLTRGLLAAGTAASAVVWGYAVFVINDSAFLTGVIDGAYTLAFAVASTWLTIRGRSLSDRASIAASAFASAAVLAVVGLLTGMHNYASLVVLVLVMGFATGVNYPAWYSLLRRTSGDTNLVRRIGVYEAFRVVAVLAGTAGGGLIGHLLGVEPAVLLSAVAIAAGGALALTFPRSGADAVPVPAAANVPAEAFDRELYRRARLQLRLLAALQFLLTPIVAVTPVLAVEGVEGGVSYVGILAALYAVGGVLQFVTSKAAARGVRLRVIVPASLGLMSASAILAAVLDDLPSAGFMMASFGFGVSSIATLINAEIQLTVPEMARDKQVATFALVFSVPVAFGSAAWGLAADFVSVPTIAIIATTIAGGIALLLLIVWRLESGRWSKSAG